MSFCWKQKKKEKNNKILALLCSGQYAKTGNIEKRLSRNLMKTLLKNFLQNIFIVSVQRYVSSILWIVVNV